MAIHCFSQVYNYYDMCYGTSGITYEEPNPMTSSDRAAHLDAIRGGAPFGAGVKTPRLGGALNDYPCGGQHAMELWLAMPEVQAALHVNGSKHGMA
jgi:hypothetical protein